ncbi:uncharacterized protein LOC142225392 [Haematobia irritans]|uniref:uncharacterized protein LOC142225392 n=1 Tax=Haematobia irritans TaxID=7368 RepID=UPI003F4FF976
MSHKRTLVETDPKRLHALNSAHKKSIENAQSKIDMKPIKLMANTFLDMNKIRSDFMVSKKILDNNIKLLRRINYIQRTHGNTENYNKYKGQRATYLENANKRIKKIQNENLIFGRRLLQVKSSLDTHRSSKDVHSTRREVYRPKLNDNMVEAYMSATHIVERPILEKLLRPQVYLDLFVENLKPLGRLTMQLYTEACPDLVLEFVRLCTYNSNEHLKFVRIFPLLWIEGELLVENSVLSRSNYEFRIGCLDQTQSRGVLSFSKSHLNGFPLGILSFTISFKTLPIARAERIAFGIVCKDLRALDSLPAYGTKNGKTTKSIIVAGCGLL